MRIPVLASLAVLAVVPQAYGQTAYNYYEVIPWAFRLGPRSDYPLFAPALFSGSYFSQVAAARGGALYIGADSGIQKISPQGEWIPLAGFGTGSILPGERVPGLLSAIAPSSMAEDSQGNLFLGNSNGVYRLGTDGLIELYAPLSSSGIAIDARDAIYTLVNGNQVVKIAPDRSVTVVAGTGVGGFSGDGGPAAAAQINVAYGIAFDSAGNLWIADTNNNRIRKVDSNGTIQTVLETPSPYTLALDASGTVYFAPWDSGKVSRLTPAGVVETVAQLPRGVMGLAVNQEGNLYIADSSRLRVLERSGVLRSLAGCLCGGEGLPAAWSRVGSAVGLVRDRAGNTYFSDQVSHMVRRIAADGKIYRVAGTGDPGFNGDGGPAGSARLSSPAGLAMDAAGNLYIADEQNNRIRRVSPAGIINTVAGNGEAKFAGDGGPAVAASLSGPDGIAVDGAGSLYIADAVSHRIRKVTPDGIIHTLAGQDAWGNSGDGGPAAMAQLINPRGLVVDAAGNVVFTDSSARVVRRITPGGFIERVAGTGQAGVGVGVGGPAIAAPLDLPWGIALDSEGNILFGDGNAVRVVDRSGVLRALAFGTAKALTVDANGDIWLATGNTVAVASKAGPPFPLGPMIKDQSILNAASAGSSLILLSAPSAAVAPGEIVTIRGVRFGSNPAAVRVWFNDITTSVLSVQDDRLTAIVPFAIASVASVQVAVEVNGVSSNRTGVAVLPAVPGVAVHNYGALSTAAALNQNGTANGPGSPEMQGNVVALFVTGAGEMIPAEKDGEILSDPPLPVPRLPVSVKMAGRLVEVLYAGAAPGLVAGSVQVNIRIPAELSPTPLPGRDNFYTTELQVGNAKANAVSVFVAPR